LGFYFLIKKKKSLIKKVINQKYKLPLFYKNIYSLLDYLFRKS